MSTPTLSKASSVPQIDELRPIAILPSSLHPVTTRLLRVGCNFDGGYIVSKVAIEKANHLISFGINTDWSFEADFARLKQCRPKRESRFSGIDAWDPTLNSKLLVRSTWKHVARRITGGDVSSLGTLASYRRLFRQPNIRHHRAWIGEPSQPDSRDLEDCLGHLPSNNHRCYLKIDIEGSEYAILEQVADNHERITGWSIEFHNFFESWERYQRIFDKLFGEYFVSHVHVNNFAPLSPNGIPEVIEVSWLNRNLVSQPKLVEYALPINDLDQPNNRKRPDIAIRFIDNAQFKGASSISMRMKKATELE